jgi:hypothetical protein
MSAADIAYYIAAGASAVALATSIYVARYAVRASRTQEWITWARQQFADEVSDIISKCREMIERDERDRRTGPSRETEEYVDPLELVRRLLHMTINAPARLSMTASSLASAIESWDGERFGRSYVDHDPDAEPLSPEDLQAEREMVAGLTLESNQAIERGLQRALADLLRCARSEFGIDLQTPAKKRRRGPLRRRS